MSEFIACFVHRGSNTFLSIAVAHAKHAGFKPVVIGDLPARCRDADYVDIREFDRVRSSFRSINNHISVNNYEYELFCYERWFILREFMGLINQPIWTFDHDVLCFDGITSLSDGLLWSNRPKPFMMNSAWTSLISDRRPLDALTEYYCKVFQDTVLCNEFAQKYSQEGVPHLSDMYLLVELSKLNKSMFLDVASKGEQMGIDANFLQCANTGTDFELLSGYKLVSWDRGRPFVKCRNGDCQRFYALHFQGISKYLMPSMAQVPFENEEAIREFCTRTINGGR